MPLQQEKGQMATIHPMEYHTAEIQMHVHARMCVYTYTQISDTHTSQENTGEKKGQLKRSIQDGAIDFCSKTTISITFCLCINLHTHKYQVDLQEATYQVHDCLWERGEESSTGEGTTPTCNVQFLLFRGGFPAPGEKASLLQGIFSSKPLLL